MKNTPPCRQRVARQGVTGHNVRYVLLASTAAIVALFAIVYIAFFT